METGFWIGFINIIILDLVLSGDNAVVIGMAARNLPAEQRKKAILLGTGVAIGLRAALTMIATYLLKIPLLMTVGGLLLIWIAVKLLIEKEDKHADVSPVNNLRSAIKTIIIADVVMSLDNVLAVAGAAHGNVFLVLFGLALSIPIIMWGSKLIATIMNKFPWIVYVGAAILGYTAGDLIVGDKYVKEWITIDMIETLIPIVLAVVVLVVGMILRKRMEASQKTI
jgi:YjbE family integral membrane protein